MENEPRNRVSSFRIEDILASSPNQTRDAERGEVVGRAVPSSPCNDLSFGVDRILAAQGMFGLTSLHHDHNYQILPEYWNPAYTCHIVPRHGRHGCESCSRPTSHFLNIDMRFQDPFSQCQRYSLSPDNQQSMESLPNQTRPRKPRRPWTRAVFSNLQRKGLEKRFQAQKYLTKADRHQLASMLGLSDNQVKVWFQNRRMKWRQEARESVTSTNPDDDEDNPK